ncbi:hypothetical protein L596_027004 [Steinernema carpocapsae]|uniref:Uncharacterized protein n=1 Tax=Steinernema carpocapsae TaxID=34508 RepID=A0A4U5M3Y3_STECR|nr:hypothetical protein L596_027004 [Steinernema carpocapsae]
MKEDHGLKFKAVIMKSIVADQGLDKINEITKAQSKKDEEFMKSLPRDVVAKGWKAIQEGRDIEKTIKKLREVMERKQKRHM